MSMGSSSSFGHGLSDRATCSPQPSVRPPMEAFIAQRKAVKSRSTRARLTSVLIHTARVALDEK
jgi:hypothetical protein